MPFDATNRVVYGADARRVPTWARDTLIAYLAAKLNDSEGDYYEALGLDSTPVAVLDENGDPTGETAWTRPVLITSVAAIADALYAQPDIAADADSTRPVVFVAEGAASSRCSGKCIGGTAHTGQMWSVTLHLDSGVENASGEAGSSTRNPTNDANADAALANAITDIITRNRIHLQAAGLINCLIQNDNEAQRAGVGRAPRVVTCNVKALDNYAP